MEVVMIWVLSQLGPGWKASQVPLLPWALSGSWAPSTRVDNAPRRAPPSGGTGFSAPHPAQCTPARALSVATPQHWRVPGGGGRARLRGEGVQPSRGDRGPRREGLRLEERVGWAPRAEWHNGTRLQLPAHLPRVLWQVGGSGRRPSVSWGPWNSHPCLPESPGEEQERKERPERKSLPSRSLGFL